MQKYLRSVTDGIESLYAALAVLVKRPFKDESWSISRSQIA